MFWNVRAIPSRVILCRFCPENRYPSNRVSPDVGS